MSCCLGIDFLSGNRSFFRTDMWASYSYLFHPIGVILVCKVPTHMSSYAANIIYCFTELWYNYTHTKNFDLQGTYNSEGLPDTCDQLW